MLCVHEPQSCLYGSLCSLFLESGTGPLVDAQTFLVPPQLLMLSPTQGTACSSMTPKGLPLVLRLPWPLLAWSCLVELKPWLSWVMPLFSWSTSSSSFLRKEGKPKTLHKKICIFLTHLVGNLVGTYFWAENYFSPDFGRPYSFVSLQPIMIDRSSAITVSCSLR